MREILQNETSSNKFTNELSNEDYKIQASTLNALQEIIEAFLIAFFFNKCITHLHYYWSFTTFTNILFYIYRQLFALLTCKACNYLAKEYTLNETIDEQSRDLLW